MFVAVLRTKTVIFFIFFLFSILGKAQEGDLEVSAQVDRDNMSLGDTLSLTISVSSEKKYQIETPRVDHLKDFNLLNQWQTSHFQSNYVNGQLTNKRTQSFHFMLEPQKEGSLRIEFVSVFVEGRQYQTQPILIQVAKKSSGTSSTPRPQKPSPQPQNPSSPFLPSFPQFDDLDEFISRFFSGKDFLMGKPLTKEQKENAFFIHLNVDKRKVYVGEAIRATWHLYTPARIQIRDIDTLKYPELKGFWKEDVKLATNLIFKPESLKGINYKKALLVSYDLFPIKAGQGVIDPYQAKCTVIFPFQGSFFKPVEQTKKSRQMEIEILPLPTQGKSAHFTGGVGQFKMNVNVEENQVQMNQPIAFQVRFEGKGNAKLIDVPKIVWPEGVEIYDTKSESQYVPREESYKEFEFLIIPRREGKIQIDSFKVSFFDPQKEAYYTKSSQPILLNVSGGAPVSNLNPLSSLKSEKPQTTTPQLILRWEPSDSYFGKNFLFLFWFLAFGLTGSFFFFKIYAVLKKSHKKAHFEKEIEKKLRVLRILMAYKKWQQVGIEGTNIIYFLLGEVSQQGGASLTLDQLLLKALPSLRHELGERFKKLTKDFELLGFAPDEMASSVRKKSFVVLRVRQLEALTKQVMKSYEVKT